MIPKIQLINKSLINKIRDVGGKDILLFEISEKYDFESDSYEKYDDQEISLMYYGAYVDRKLLISDEGKIININKVKSIYCDIAEIKSIKNVDIDDKFNIINILDVKSFYINSYIIEEIDWNGNIIQHNISRFLANIGAIKKDPKSMKYYIIQNNSRELQQFNNILLPKDIFFPIKFYINGLFYNDHYYFSDFKIHGPYLFKN